MSTSGASTAGLNPGDSPATVFSSERIGKFGYGIGISVGILLLITTITLMSYFCTRSSTAGNSSSPSRHRHHYRDDDEDDNNIEAGLDEATLKSWAKVTYAEAKRRDPRAGDAGCSVCLADYADEELLRLLPECGHLFHVRCVDPWLRHHPTCPVCRSSPVPTPLPTPLAEVVPLAAATR
ncbi:hypothetical protein IEQ34_017533 [Dendrobium chrysotoxum]|uniref:RING-type E3 ubiquitin transferase n=1 Tax=Dendrobium chrysotoxum TaxID=161865 RepID=A0AAV7FU95_DENCH|nr:hypothetical protein IEQ34_017533 [Dendrobium chrysotoxum]